MYSSIAVKYFLALFLRNRIFIMSKLLLNCRQLLKIMGKVMLNAFHQIDSEIKNIKSRALAKNENKIT